MMLDGARSHLSSRMTDDPQAPWGGFKYSGVGREYGQYGIEAFLEPKAILEA
jgi:aldehyde dehydrogenase (NAD+)